MLSVKKLSVKKPLLLVLLLYYALCFSTFGVWQAAGRYPPKGDEGHYLVMADGWARYRSWEQTRPYADEFRRRRFEPLGWAAVDAIPSPKNTHGFQGPNGLFNVHSIGLPLLIAIPLALGGVVGAKVFLILLSGLAVILVWRWACYGVANFCGTAGRSDYITPAWVTVAVTCAMPLTLAANQIYPDWVGGLFTLLSLTCLAEQRQLNRNSRQVKAGDGWRSWRNWVGLIAAAFLPWLHLKFAIATAISTSGLAWVQWSQQRSKTVVWMAIPSMLSALALAGYNHYAFGNIAGPYGEGALVLHINALMVFVGLHLDQFQGMFWQNPSLLLGLIYWPWLWRRDRLIAGVLLAIYLSFVVPNSMHLAWYGAMSFTGRFGWSGAFVLFPAAVFALIELAGDRKQLTRYGCAGLFGFHLLMFARYTFSDLELYNTKSLLSEDYPTFLPWLSGKTPMFYDGAWAFTDLTNQVWILGFLLLLLVGGLSSWLARQRLLRWGLVGLFGVGCVSVGLAGPRTSYPITTLLFSGRGLPSLSGRTVDEEHGRFAQAGQDEPGFLIYGPYIVLPAGAYQASLDYQTTANSVTAVADWDVVMSPSDKVLAAGILNGEELSKQWLKFKIPPSLSSELVQVRVFWHGQEDMRFDYLRIRAQRSPD